MILIDKLAKMEQDCKSVGEALARVQQKVGVNYDIEVAPYWEFAMRWDGGKKFQLLYDVAEMHNSPLDEIEATIAHELGHIEGKHFGHISDEQSRLNEHAADLFAAKHGYAEPFIRNLERVRHDTAECRCHPSIDERIRVIRAFQAKQAREAVHETA